MSSAPEGWWLDASRGVKPLDFGADGVTGSIDADGRLIAVNSFHPRHGYVTLTVADPFAEDRRYDPAAVRAYRARLVRLAGFGPHLAAPVARREAWLLDGAIPRVRLVHEDGATAEVTTLAHAGGALQVWQIAGAAPRWGGRLSLQRCAYTQLTEGGPLPMPPLQVRLTFADGVLAVENPALGWAAALAGLPEGPAWARAAESPLEIELAGQAGTTVLAVGFGPDAQAARARALHLAALDALQVVDQARRGWRARLAGTPDDRMVQRGLVYGLVMAVPVGETCCILTDHMLLPLAWNRDAYYVARALLSWRADLAKTVRRHLLWTFEVAARPAGTWGRCYLANGLLKDGAFQLDQQLFPLLELADYLLATGDRALAGRLAPHVAPLLDALLARKAPGAWLFPTDETPADDPVALPYHLSSHILMWHTLRRLVEAGLGDNRLAALAESVRAAVMAHFVAVRDGQRLFAYATDGRGAYHFYHDANDLPLALAPAWGFVRADDPVWRATVDFAFSPANAEGYYAPGLGSVHTRAPWPLGDVQDMIIAHALGDAARADRALARLHAAAQWDGALPEAYDPVTHEVVSRHWFAWPNAALASMALGSFDLPDNTRG